jgi:ribosomal protein S12 methylthiotransferase
MEGELMRYKVFFETLGCAKNQVDTEVMIGLLDKNSYTMTPNVEDADIIAVNTCGFIESAKTESIEMILELSTYKVEGKCQMLIVTGCLAERYAEELKKEIPEIDVFVGTGSFDEIIPIIDKVLQNESTEGALIQKGDINKDFAENLPRILMTPAYMAYLKIAEGCDNCCTYCIIPKLRGKYRSRKFEDVVSEAKSLVSKGVKELIIIAQDITRFGQDIYGKYRLADLLYELNEIEGLKWIRLQYCYPDVVDDQLIEAIAKCDKVAKYIDIPIQHCNDTMLKRMNRTTSKASIVALIEKLRAAVPEISIRSTLIAGFPGETEEMFEELLAFVKEQRLDKLGAFAYSLEEDTAAVKLPDHLEQEVKEARRDAILELQQQISTELMYQKVGKTLEVVIEEEVAGENIYVGRTMYDAPEIDGVVYVHTDRALRIGQFVMVKITDAMEYDLIGEM